MDADSSVNAPGSIPKQAETASGAAGLAERTLAHVRDRLAALDDLPTSDHVAVFDDLHRELSGVLGVLDQGTT